MLVAVGVREAAVLVRTADTAVRTHIGGHEENPFRRGVTVFRLKPVAGSKHSTRSCGTQSNSAVRLHTQDEGMLAGGNRESRDGSVKFHRTPRAQRDFLVGDGHLV